MVVFINELILLLAVHLLEEEHQTLGIVVVLLWYIYCYVVIKILVRAQTFKFMDVVVEVRGRIET